MLRYMVIVKCQPIYRVCIIHRQSSCTNCVVFY